MPIRLLAITFVLLVPDFASAAAAAPRVRVDADPGTGRVTHLGWDTEGRSRATVNLLRPTDGFTVRLRESGSWRVAQEGDAALRWLQIEGGFDVTCELRPELKDKVDAVGLVFGFEPRHSAVTVIPASVDADETFHFPAVVHAPGSGAMLVTPDEGAGPNAMRLEGSRKDKRVDWTAILGVAGGDQPRAAMHFRPLVLAMPKGMKDEAYWRAVRRAWLNVFQVSSRWGDPENPSSAPAGMLSNNVISDPVSSCLYMYADLALFTPEIAPGVSLMNSVGHTLDWWIDKRTLPTGEVYGYTSYTNFTDTNPSILISAWDVVEATGDKKWLAARIEKLEKLAAFMTSRDVDHDGLIEAVQSGDAYTLKLPARSCSAHDAVNCGHKDAYSNELAYRAYRCLADLERQLGRTEQQKLYTKQADDLKRSFRAQLINPKTGWVMMWRSRDNAVHDPAAPWINCLAIQYGLVTPAEGREIMTKLLAKMRTKGFKRFDLGIPTCLDPIPRGDYLLDAVGCPKLEDGSDTFGYYLNGGVIQSDGVRWSLACHMVGMHEEGDHALDAMLGRLAKVDLDSGGFPINVVDAYPAGGEFFTWDGKTCGYEGLLSHAYYWVSAAVMREPDMQRRLFRPLETPADQAPGK